MAAAMKVAKNLNEDQVCVVLCPDNIRNYMTKFIVDNWMEARGFKECENVFHHVWWEQKIHEIIDKPKRHAQITMSSKSKTCEVIEMMKTSDVDQIPILDENGKLEGVATCSFLMNKMLDLSLNQKDEISKNLFKKYVKISSSSSLGKLSRILEKETFVVISFADFENGS